MAEAVSLPQTWVPTKTRSPTDSIEPDLEAGCKVGGEEGEAE
jgi:hypothetical protein